MQLIDRVRAIMLTPQKAWPAIAQDASRPWTLLGSYVAVLAAIPEVANFIGESLIGGFQPVLKGLTRAIVVYAAAFVIVCLIAFIIDTLAPRYGGRKSFSRALKLAVYAHTPLWLAGIFLLIPGLSFLLILGVYGVYLLWTGLPVLMEVPSSRALPYAIVVTACALIPPLVLSMI